MHEWNRGRGLAPEPRAEQQESTRPHISNVPLLLLRHTLSLEKDRLTGPGAKVYHQHQKLEEARRILPWSPWREWGPADTLILDF